MQENVILLVIDSLSFERLSGKYHSTPFLTSLMNKSVSCEKMFAQAPFTEAAVMGLIAGCRTMDFGGYIKRFADIPKTLPEVFAERGYEVYQYIQPHIYPTSLERNVPFSYYNVGFDFQALWGYRLKYYQELYKKDGLQKRDYQLIIEILKDNFIGWKLFLKRLIHHDDKVSLIADNLREYPVEEILSKVISEEKSFVFDPQAYIMQLFFEGEKHVLFQITTLNQEKKIRNPLIKEAFIEKYKPLFQRIYQVDRQFGISFDREVIRNIKNMCKSFLLHPEKEKLKDIIRFKRYIQQRTQESNIMERIASNYDAYKNAPSFQSHLNHFYQWLDEKRDISKPFFGYIHVDDIHNPEVFFTYDSYDLKLLDDEMQDVINFLDKLGDGYHGSITYDLGLQYIDKKIASMFDYLEKIKMLENTTIYIAADHGFSFYNVPLRETVPNNFYCESYHVPFIAYNSGYQSKRIKEFHQTMDIPATILSQAGIAIPEHFVGKDIFKNEQVNNYVTVEYMGGGCPDIWRRPVRYGIRNQHYNLVYYAKLTQDFSEGRLEQLFDLSADPLEQKNLVYSKKVRNNSEVAELLDILARRHAEIRETMKP